MASLCSFDIQPLSCYLIAVGIRVDQNKLRQICSSHGVSRLEVFGSALRDDFRPDSDVDLLATIRADARLSLLDWVALKNNLSEVFGRPVDLVSRRAMERSGNNLRRKSILNSVQPLYDEG